MIESIDKLTGKVIGTCMLETLIGRGGMSVVFRAQQVRPLRRTVAVKILLPFAPIGSELHNQFLARFQREARIISNLQHLNIIQLYEYSEQNGDAYLVMPYLSGGSLSKVLARRGTLTLQEALNHIEQAAAALDYAHKHRVIHRDLKPGNFLLDVDGRLVLADFGIAHMMRESGRSIVSTLTNPGLLLGTPDYMSPEMVQGEQIDHRSDIYELGIVLFQMLSGDVPFKGNAASILIKHVKVIPPLLHLMNPAIPPAVDDVLQKAMAKRREDRFASAGDMAQALRLAIATPRTYPTVVSVSYAPTVLSAASPSTNNPYIPMLNQTLATKAGEEQPPALSVSNISSNKQRRPKKILAIFLGVIAFMLVIGALPFALWIAGLQQGQSKLPAQQGSSLLPSQQAEATVQQYYDYWNQEDYPDAYNLLASDYRSSHSYSSLLESYRATRHASIQILSVMPLPDGSYKVELIDTASEENTPGTLTPHVYNGYYIVELENGSWKLYPHFTYSQRS
jgi:serine/threonine protein kinase